MQLLACASDRDLIDGEHVFQRCRVLYVYGEDGVDEVRRRRKAAMLHYGIAERDIAGFFFEAPLTGLDWKLLAKGDLSLERRLRRFIVEHKIDLVCLDPLVKTHAADENSNQEMDSVVTALAALAHDLDVALDFTHHTNKGEHAAWKAVQKFVPGLEEKTCRAIIRKWIADGVLEETDYRAPNRHWQKGLRLSPSRTE